MGNVHATFLHRYNNSSNNLSVQNPILTSQLKVLRASCFQDKSSESMVAK